MNPGDFVLSITADGYTLESPGDGCLGPSFRYQFMRQLWWRSWEARVSQSELT